MTKKAFNELTKGGKTRRINAHEKDLAEKGWKEGIGRLVNEPKWLQYENGDYGFVARYHLYNKHEKKSFFATGSRYVKHTAEKNGNFLKTLHKGDLVNVEYAENGQFLKIMNIFDRRDSDKARQKAKAVAKS